MAQFAVVGLDGAYMSSLGTFLDAFILIRHQVAALYRARGHVQMTSSVQLITPHGGAVQLAGGRTLDCDGGIDGKVQFNLIHLPSFLMGGEEQLDARLAANGELLAWLQRQHAGGAIISGSGPAIFLLMEAGLIEGGEVAVPQVLVPLFRQRYPHIRVDKRSSVNQHDQVFTVRGLAAEFSLMTQLTALITTPHIAGWLATVVGLDQLEATLSSDPLVANAQIWLGEHFASDIQIADLAKAMSVSHQTLLRHFRKALGITPLAHLQMLRVRAAEHMLLQTGRSVKEIAALTGYDDLRSFRNVFRQITGTTPAQYRARAGAGFQAPE